MKSSVLMIAFSK